MTRIIFLLVVFGFSFSVNASSENCINSFESEDYQKASIECIEPANLGETYPQNILGWIYLKGLGVNVDYQKSFEWLSKSSQQGNIWAKGQLGLIYQNGNGEIPQDYDKALTFLTEAGEEWSEELQILKSIIQKEEINNSIEKIKIMKPITADRIGKWYGSDSDLENITCNGEDTSEIILLHNKVLMRNYSDDYSLIESDLNSSYTVSYTHLTLPTN